MNRLRRPGGALPSLALPILALLFLALRLPALTALPLFNDEAVYILRAERFPAMLASNRGPAGATLPDGKLLQELLLAALAPLPVDPLLPARLLSVACGLGTLLALAALGRAVGQPWAGALAGLLYALSPLPAIHDVLGLPDSMLTLVSALLLLASLTYALRPQPRRRDALLVGALLGAASLVKLSGLLLLAVPVLAALILPAGRSGRLARLAPLRLALIVALAAVAVLAPFHYGGAERQKLGGDEGRAGVLAHNAADAGDWLLRYLPGPVLLPPLLLLALRGRWRPKAEVAPLPGGGHAPASVPPSAARLAAFLLLTGLAVAGAFVVVGTTLYPRYLLAAWPPLLLAAALGSAELWRMGAAWRATTVLALLVGGGWGVNFAWRFATEPRTAPLAAADRRQYLEGWTAGQNLGPLLADLRAEARGGLTVVNHTQPRLVNLATRIYLRDTPAVRFAELDLSAADAAARLANLAAGGPTVVVADRQVADAYALTERFPGLRLLRGYQNPDSPMQFLLFTPQP